MNDVLALEQEIGRDLVALLDKELHISVDDALSVRVRNYAADRRAVLIDVATTPQRALNIAALFTRVALRADPSLRLQMVEDDAAPAQPKGLVLDPARPAP